MQNFRKYLALILVVLFCAVGCKQNKTTMNLVEPDYVNVVSSEKHADAPDYEWVSNSEILFEDGKPTEFIRQTHIFDSPLAEVEVDRTCHYFQKNPLFIYEKTNTKAKWTKAKSKENDEYSVLRDLFLALLDEFKIEDKDNFFVYSVEKPIEEVKNITPVFNDVKAEKLNFSYKLEKTDDKYTLKEVLVEGRNESDVVYTKKYFIWHINEKNHIEPPMDLIKMLIKDGGKKYDNKES